MPVADTIPRDEEVAPWRAVFSSLFALVGLIGRRVQLVLMHVPFPSPVMKKSPRWRAVFFVAGPGGPHLAPSDFF